MEIYVNGEQLDIVKGQKVEINWKNIRFSEAIADEWTTDIEMPNNPHNIRLLDGCALLSRGGIYTDHLPCQIMINGISREGYLHVTKFTSSSIFATCYLLAIPYALYDRQISDWFLEDSGSTIFRWDRYTTPTYDATSDIAVRPYDYNHDYYSNISAQWHTSIRAKLVTEQIENAEGITLPQIDNDLFLLSTKKVVCPQNRIQCFSGTLKGTADLDHQKVALFGGQHITNDLQCSWSYADFKWNDSYTDINAPETIRRMQESAPSNTIKFNRPCKANIKVYGISDRCDIDVEVWRNNHNLCDDILMPTSLLTLPHVYNDTPPQWNLDDALAYLANGITFNAGDELSISFEWVSLSPYKTVINFSVVIEYYDYDITEDDYSTELNYLPAPFGLSYSYLSGLGEGEGHRVRGMRYLMGGRGFGEQGFLDHSYCYYGAWANLGSCSVREYLSSMCWVHDRKLKLDGFELSFDDAYQTVDLGENAEITEIESYTDKLARRNVISYAVEDIQPLYWNIDNEWLDASTEIHKSVFSTAQNLYGPAIFDQYVFEEVYTDEDDVQSDETTTKRYVRDIDVQFNEFDFVLLELEEYNGRYVLTRAPRLTTFGLDEITATIAAKIETYEDCRDRDYVVFEGRDFLIVEGTTDIGTGLNSLKCLEVYRTTEEGCTDPTAVVNAVPDYDSATIEVAITSVDPDSSYTLRVNGIDNVVYPGTSYVSVGGLLPSHVYAWTLTGEDRCGELSESGSFITLSGRRPSVEIDNAFNITSTSAVFNVHITEN